MPGKGQFGAVRGVGNGCLQNIPWRVEGGGWRDYSRKEEGGKIFAKCLQNPTKYRTFALHEEDHLYDDPLVAAGGCGGKGTTET